MLEILKQTNKLAGKKVAHLKTRVSPENFADIKKQNQVILNYDDNAITFYLKKDGKDAEKCSVNTLVVAANMLLRGMLKEKPTRELALTLTKLDEAFMWLSNVEN